MDCNHIEEAITTDILHRLRTNDVKFQCSECSTVQSPWICLSCCIIYCGRYVNGHALRHYETNDTHMICMSIETGSLYCYKCDNDVEPNVEDSRLAWLRHQIFSMNSPLDQSDTSNASASDLRSDSSGSVAEESERVLRPRKRTNLEKEDLSDSRQSRKMARTRSKLEESKVVGLRNLGNTCFMNAVLQSLNNIHPFSFYIKRLPSFENMNNATNKKYGSSRQLRSTKEIDDVVMAEELRKILLSLNKEYEGVKQNAISPESLFLAIWKVVPRFRGYQQQDAHEFLRYVLDRLHTELLLLLPEFSFSIGEKGRASIVTCMFGGVLQSEVLCLNCSVVSKTQDPFLDLSLDIPDKYLPKHISSRRTKNTEEDLPSCRVHDCLSSFVEIEELAESELYYCNTCKSKERSTKRFWIRRLPNVLCLHLKRFRWTNYYRTKIDNPVQFPVEALDMSEFVLRDVRDTRQSGAGCCLYDLAAVIVHHGSGAGSGHYTAFAIHNGQWFHFNDSSVQPVLKETVEKCKPYILFYIRKEVRLPKLFCPS